MTKKSRLKLLFKSLFVQFGSVKTDEGVQLLWEPETELIVGYDVYIEQENENGELEYVPAPDGEYKSGDTTFVIEGGKCVEIRNKEEEAPAQEPAEEDLEEQPAEEPAEETPDEETPSEEPEFDAQKAIADLRAEYDAKLNELTEQLNNMREQLEALLALPAEENAFQKESTEESKNKPIFKSRK